MDCQNFYHGLSKFLSRIVKLSLGIVKIVVMYCQICHQGFSILLLVIVKIIIRISQNCSWDSLCSILNFNVKVGLHQETQQKLLLECYWSWILEKFQKLYDGLCQYFIFCKWASPKMYQIIIQTGHGGQLFETVNFSFMKIFDFFSQNSRFQGISLFWRRFASCISSQITSSITTVTHDANLQKQGQMP